MDPGLILVKQKRIRLVQDNIFGVVHTALETLQQFQLICGVVEALTRAAAELNCAFSDPTQAVLGHGPKDAIIDLGHDRPEFEPVIADLLLPQAEALRARPTTR